MHPLKHLRRVSLDGNKWKEAAKMKKAVFTVNGKRYKAPWIVAKAAPFVIVLGQMVLVVGTAVCMFVVAYGMQ